MARVGEAEHLSSHYFMKVAFIKGSGDSHWNNPTGQRPIEVCGAADVMELAVERSYLGTSGLLAFDCQGKNSGIMSCSLRP